MAAWVLASAILEQFGGDTMEELRERVAAIGSGPRGGFCEEGTDGDASGDVAGNGPCRSCHRCGSSGALLPRLSRRIHGLGQDHGGAPSGGTPRRSLSGHGRSGGASGRALRGGTFRPPGRAGVSRVRSGGGEGTSAAAKRRGGLGGGVPTNRELRSLLWSGAFWPCSPSRRSTALFRAGSSESRPLLDPGRGGGASRLPDGGLCVGARDGGHGGTHPSGWRRSFCTFSRKGNLRKKRFSGRERET
jgi:hypothetical protein